MILEELKKGKVLGKGGNATIYELIDYPDYALKKLNLKKRSDDKIKWDRFMDEIQVMEVDLKGMAGVMPVIESNQDEAWYIMPKATTLVDYFEQNQSGIREKVLVFKELCGYLKDIHSKGYSHRDIKPDNLYFFDGHPVFGDFGLVDFPDKLDLTLNNRPVGAKFTIAPEMERMPKDSDGIPADVYSMAKTLWMLLANDTLGFPGTYDPYSSRYSLRKLEASRDFHLIELERLITSATSDVPEKRPSLQQFIYRIEQWELIEGNIELEQESEWNELARILGSKTIPRSSEWTEPKDIVNVLNVLGSSRAYNYMFFPRGGLEFEEAKLAGEKGCIEIWTSCEIDILKPKRLIFEHVDGNRWDYFFFELYNLTHMTNCPGQDEFVVEDFSGHYVPNDNWVYRVDDYDSGVALPSGAREVCRLLSGNLLISSKYGPYNQMGSTDDGRHCQCTHTQFREYIDWLAKYENDHPDFDITSLSLNPFQGIKNCHDTPNFNHWELKNPYHWLESNYKKIQIPALNSVCNPDAKVSYFMRVDIQCVPLIDVFNHTPKHFYLDKSGKIREMSSDEVLNDAWHVEGMANAITEFAKIEHEIESLIDKTQYDIENYHIGEVLKPVLLRTKAPSHLIEKEEIYELTKTADDRHNNMIVLDEDGFPILLSDDEQINLGKFYPAKTNRYLAYHNYIGKYTKEFCREDSYRDLLNTWLYHLQGGDTNVYGPNSFPERDSDEIRSEIVDLLKQCTD